MMRKRAERAGLWQFFREGVGVRYLAGASSVVGRVGNEHPAPKQRG